MAAGCGTIVTTNEGRPLVEGLRVAIAGAGLGGLCLAQGLYRAGADVTVYERDAALDSRPQGYRLHLDARAAQALQQCLPPQAFQLFLATCGQPGRRMTVLSERLRVLREIERDPGRDPLAPATLSTSANRQTLREVMAGGLAGRIRFGCELAGFEEGATAVRLRFAGGGHADAELLVGADGVSSAVRQQYLPAAGITDTGSRCIYGKTLLSGPVRELLPPSLHAGFTAIVGRSAGMAAGLVEFRRRPEQAAAEIAPDIRVSPAADYLMWAISAGSGHFPVPDAQLRGLPPAGLHAVARRLIRSWHPDLQRLVGLADIGQTFLVRIRTSVPGPDWRPGRVTLLGDAIHAMSPARGSGANTALQDAALLCRLLTSAPPGGPGLIAAVGEYETQMREYGYAAVRASREAEAGMGAQRGGLARWLYRRLARGAPGAR
jgi:2-polyprenyl-6-methoxyphenol hydroxylase-like FAD-dependent oxidoreductase